MRKLVWSLALLLFAPLCGVQAQVTLEILVDQDQLLRDESFIVKARIVNRSGQTLRLGGDNKWLSFVVESKDGGAVTPRQEIPVQEEFLLESASAATRQFDLMPIFGLSRPGRYTVAARLQIKDWDREVSSVGKAFSVIPGFKVWEQEFGVPAPAGEPEVRKWLLQQARAKELMLYARLADASDNFAFRVQPLGPLVSFSKPEAQMDKNSNLHVLFQTGARRFLYIVLNPDGELVQRQTHEYSQTRPVLRSDDSGQVIVAGGARRPASNDYPSLPIETTNAPAGKP